jgi:hypothetical protein
MAIDKPFSGRSHISAKGCVSHQTDKRGGNFHGVEFDNYAGAFPVKQLAA